MEAAAKAAQEEARKKAEERRKKVADKPVANPAARLLPLTPRRPPRRRACSETRHRRTNRLPGRLQQEEVKTDAPG